MNELFAKILLADEPHKNFRDKLSMYEPLIGNWEFEWKGNMDGSGEYRKGSTRRRSAIISSKIQYLLALLQIDQPTKAF